MCHTYMDGDCTPAKHTHTLTHAPTLTQSVCQPSHSVRQLAVTLTVHVAIAPRYCCSLSPQASGRRVLPCGCFNRACPTLATQCQAAIPQACTHSTAMMGLQEALPMYANSSPCCQQGPSTSRQPSAQCSSHSHPTASPVQSTVAWQCRQLCRHRRRPACLPQAMQQRRLLQQRMAFAAPRCPRHLLQADLAACVGRWLFLACSRARMAC